MNIVWVMAATLILDGSEYNMREGYPTQQECEQRGEEIYVSYKEFYHDAEIVPPVQIECWEVEVEKRYE